MTRTTRPIVLVALALCAACQFAQQEKRQTDDTAASREEIHRVTETGSRKAVNTATQFGWDLSKFLSDNAGLISLIGVPLIGLLGHKVGKSSAEGKITKERAAKWVRHSDAAAAKATGAPAA